jgi:hypothetical protein
VSSRLEVDAFISRVGLARVERSAGNAAEAYVCFKLALDSVPRELVGSVSELMALSQMAVLLEDLGRGEDSEPIYRRILSTEVTRESAATTAIREDAADALRRSPRLG